MAAGDMSTKNKKTLDTNFLLGCFHNSIWIKWSSPTSLGHSGVIGESSPQTKISTCHCNDSNDWLFVATVGCKKLARDPDWLVVSALLTCMKNKRPTGATAPSDILLGICNIISYPYGGFYVLSQQDELLAVYLTKMAWKACGLPST